MNAEPTADSEPREALGGEALGELVLIGLLVLMAEVVDVLEGRRRWAVICADNRVVLPLLEARAVAHVITDPPFDEKTHRGARSQTSTYGGAVNRIDFSALESVNDLAHALLPIARRWVVCFCAQEQLGEYKAAVGPKQWIRSGFWNKPDGTPQLTGDRPGQGGEGIAVMHPPGRKRWNGGGKRAVWTHGVERVDRSHPTQKPIGLMLELISDFTDEDELILDPFAGVGSTGVAALRLRRRVILVELDPKYAAVARERLEAEKEGLSLRDSRAGQQSLFGGA
jgi:site-specific DNA-methyltransferase (adenine-specific)